MDAFEILVEQFRPMLVAYLRSLVHDPELAEDIAQDTLFSAYKSLSTFEKGGQFGAWLRGIARNKSRENLRIRQRDRAVIADSRIIEGMEEVYRTLDPGHPQAESWSDRVGFLRDCIAALNEKLKTTVQEVYLKQKSLMQLAAGDQTQYAQHAQRLSRARHLLRECMQRKLLRSDAP